MASGLECDALGGTFQSESDVDVHERERVVNEVEVATKAGGHEAQQVDGCSVARLDDGGLKVDRPAGPEQRLRKEVVERLADQLAVLFVPLLHNRGQ